MANSLARVDLPAAISPHKKINFAAVFMSSMTRYRNYAIIAQRRILKIPEMQGNALFVRLRDLAGTDRKTAIYLRSCHRAYLNTPYVREAAYRLYPIQNGRSVP